MSYQHLFLSFEGRVGRSSYWLACLVLFTANILASHIGTRLIEGPAGGGVILLGWLVILYSGAAVAAKRWHDRNKSGWWSLIALVPVIGLIWMLVENGFLPGTPGPNRFGPDPVKAARPIPVTHRDRTYYRRGDGSFTDSSGSVVRDAALLAALGSAYAASRANSAGEGHAGGSFPDDRSVTADAAAGTGDRSGGWGWSSGSDGNSGDGGGGGGGGD